MLIYMENHPIPQDVTGFQFKLIGNMTVRQFAYLATGTVLAVVLFQLPVHILIRFPFSLFFALLGVGLAYLPVGGRSMDAMIGYYIKALIRPTIFTYDGTPSQTDDLAKAPVITVKSLGQITSGLNLIPKDKLKVYLETFDAQPRNKLDEKEHNFLMSIANLAASNIVIQPGASPAPALVTQRISEQISPTPKPVDSNLVSDRPVAAPIPYEAIPLPKAEATPQIAQNPPERVTLIQPRHITKSYNKTVSVPSNPTYPNLVVGITKDSRGNALAGILVEIKDKDNGPVRAFKTNEFGKFASATPLTNGAYTIDFEDPKAQNKFEKIVINLEGQIIPPIQAISIDTREELRRSLFAPGNQSN
jgi:hypothetical protein